MKATQTGGAVNARRVGGIQGRPGAGGERERRMDDRFIERLLNGMRRLLAALRSCQKRRTTPPGPVESGTAKDQG